MTGTIPSWRSRRQKPLRSAWPTNRVPSIRNWMPTRRSRGSSTANFGHSRGCPPPTRTPRPTLCRRRFTTVRGPMIRKIAASCSTAVASLSRTTPPRRHDYMYQNTAASLSPFLDGVFSITNSNGDLNNPPKYFPKVRKQDLVRTAADYTGANRAGSTNSSVSGALVSITGDTIDINTRINAGFATDWSLSLPQNLTVRASYSMNGSAATEQVSLSRYRDLFLTRGVSGLASQIVLPVQTSRAGDAQIKAVYDAAANKIIVQNVEAASTDGFLKISGRNIINSNNLGNLHVNGGLGDVQIDNQTGIPVVVQKVYTGSAASGRRPGRRQDRDHRPGPWYPHPLRQPARPGNHDLHRPRRSDGGGTRGSGARDFHQRFVHDLAGSGSDPSHRHVERGYHQQYDPHPRSSFQERRQGDLSKRRWRTHRRPGYERVRHPRGGRRHHPAYVPCQGKLVIRSSSRGSDLARQQRTNVEFQSALAMDPARGAEPRHRL